MAATETNINELKAALLGTWASIAPEIRPSKNPASKSAEDALKPFYLTRTFVYRPGDQFELSVLNHADPFAKVAIAKIELAGHMLWRGDHSIAPGAQKVDFVADEAYAVTPLVQPFVDVLSKLAVDGFSKWESGKRQDIFGKTFVPFGLVQGRNFMEYDLVYLLRDLLFWGARNIDGRGFDSEANRPTNLQIPLIRQPG